MAPSRSSLLPVFVISGSALMAVAIAPQPADAPQNDDYLVEYRMVHEEIDGGADSGVYWYNQTRIGTGMTNDTTTKTASPVRLMSSGLPSVQDGLSAVGMQTLVYPADHGLSRWPVAPPPRSLAREQYTRCS